MSPRLRARLHQLLASLWFVPTVIVIGALLLAFGMVELSAHVDAEALARWPRIFGASADSSRSMLSAVASGMITVAGLTFSLTMLAVTQASTQFTPRVLRTFMRDRSNQFVLGTFVGIFAYCLVVLRTIRSAEEIRFVPSLAVVLGIVLAIAGVGVLIYFVHHIASTLEASGIIARVTRETVTTIDALFPEAEDPAAPDPPPEARDGGRWRTLPSRTSGYVQAIDLDALARLGARHDGTVRVLRGVGEFAAAGTPLLALRCGSACPERCDPDAPRRAGGAQDAAAAGCDAFSIGDFRTIEQDAAFGVRQLVDIALKALSPGVNDTTTAINCIDHLGALLVHLAGRRIVPPVRRVDGVQRVVPKGVDYDGIAHLAMDEIRRNAGGNVSVLARLLRMLDEVATCTPAPARRRALAGHVAEVAEVAARTVPAASDRALLATLAEAASAACGGDASNPAGAPLRGTRR